MLREGLSGSMLILGSALGFGLNPMLAQLLLGNGYSPEAIAMYRFLIPVICVSGALSGVRRQPAEAARTLGVGLISGLGMLCYFEAFTRLPASNVILLYYSYPVFSVLIGSLFFSRRPGLNSWASTFLITLAVSLVVAPDDLPGTRLPDLLMALMAPVSFALLLNYFSRPRTPMPPTRRMACGVTGHLLVVLPFLLFSPENTLLLPRTLHDGVLLLAIGVLAAAVPQYLFAVGAPRAGAERTTLIGAVELVFAMLFGVLFLGDGLSRVEVTAALLILIALVIRPETPRAYQRKEEVPF